MKEKGPPALTNRRRGGEFYVHTSNGAPPRFSKQNLVNVPRSDHHMSDDLHLKFRTDDLDDEISW
jgi:hypothetical protein